MIELKIESCSIDWESPEPIKPNPLPKNPEREELLKQLKESINESLEEIRKIK